MAVGSVPVKVVAKVYGKSESWIRAGLINGWLPIGNATKNGKLITSIDEIKPRERINYYISPEKLKEATGYEWKGEKTCRI